MEHIIPNGAHGNIISVMPAQADVASLIAAALKEMHLVASDPKVWRLSAEAMASRLRQQAEVAVQEFVPRLLAHPQVVHDVKQALVDLACQTWASEAETAGVRIRKPGGDAGSERHRMVVVRDMPTTQRPS